MPPSVPALVEPSVLRWARQSIGLSALAAGRRIGVPEGRVELWESGDARPTIAQLRSAATAYKRPLAIFFLSEPPSGFDAMRDFRRLPESQAGEWSPDLHGEFRRALRQRDYVLELFELEDAVPSKDWAISTSALRDDEQLAEAAREQLLRVGPLPLPPSSGTAHEHLNVWVAAAEEAGILVLATGRGGVSVNEMRAFSVFFDSVPVIVVNGSDGPRGRLFSLLHEYGHLLLHTGGLCDATTDPQATGTARLLEARCNRLAASMLMPTDAVVSSPFVIARRERPEDWDYPTLRAAAAPFGASAEAFLRRLVSLQLTTMTFYLARRGEFLAAYEQELSRDKPSGGDWYRTTVRDRGKAYVRQVADAYRRRVIDSYTAASYLDVKVGQIDRLAREAAQKTSGS